MNLFKDAADILNLSERQVQRLMNRLRESGAASLVHGARGKPSNNRISSDYRQTILAIVRKHYADFSPTLAQEKLLEIHKLPVSNTTSLQCE
ncbi:helix-turn-helix domain-containing protein [Vibrio eleionomae]|uniref:helix-turn-helix domain-containing protein n=1 Tax=Vibrio eleionomae TaxID=2653505 RepID=UPI0031F4587A